MAQNTGNFITDLVNSPAGKMVFNIPSKIAETSTGVAKSVFNPSPMQDAFIGMPGSGTSAEAITQDIKERETFAPPPNSYEILRSNKSLKELMPNVDTSNILDDQLKSARSYYTLRQRKDDYDYIKKNKPEQYKIMRNAYGAVLNTLAAQTQVAEREVPKVGIANWNSTSGTLDTQEKFLFWTRPEARLAINRSNFDNHIKSIGNGALENNVELRKILRDGFATGNMFLELKERTAQVGRGLLSAGTLVLQNAADFSMSMHESGYDLLGAGWTAYREKAPARTQSRKLFLEQMAQDGWVSGQTEAFNEWVKEQYLKKGNSLEDYEANMEDLILTPDHVKSIYDYSFGELNGAESAAVFLAENVGTSLGFGLAVRGGRFVTSLALHNQNPIAYQVRMETLKNVYTRDGIQPFLYSTAVDYVEQQVKAVGRNNKLAKFFWNFTLPSTRLTGRAAQGREAVKAVEELPQFKPYADRLGEARKAKLKLDATKNPTEFQKRVVEQELRSAENSYTLAVIKYNMKGLRFGKALGGYSSNEIKKIFGEEMLPAIIQNLVYEGVYRGTGNTYESQDFADLTAAGANVFAALSQNGVPGFAAIGMLTRKATGWVTKPFLEDPAFALAKWLNGSRLVQSIGGPSPLLRGDIMDLRIRKSDTFNIGSFPNQAIDENTGLTYYWRKPTREDYITLKRQREWYGRLNIETQDLIYQNAQEMNKSIEDAVSFIKDPAERATLTADLELSFGHTSQIIFFEAKAQQTATHLVNRDIERITPDFNKAVEYFLNGEKMLATQDRLIKSIEDTIARNKGDLSAGELLTAESIITMRVTALAQQKKIFDQQKNILKSIHKQLSEAMNNPDEYMRMTPEERNDTIDALYDSYSALHGVRNQTFEEGLAKLKAPSISHLNDADIVFNEAMVGIENSISNIQGLINGSRVGRDEAITVISDSVKMMQHKFKIDDKAIYKDMTKFGKVDGVTLLDDILSLEKVNDTLLAKFTMQGQFEGFHGVNFQKHMEQGASDALLVAMRKRVNPEGIDEFGLPYQKSELQIDQEATALVDQAKEHFREDLMAQYKFTDADFAKGKIKDIHLYDYLRNHTTIRAFDNKVINIEEVPMTFESMEYMRRYLQDRASQLKKANDPRHLDYTRKANELDDQLLNSKEAQKEFTLSDGTVTTIGKEIRIMRLRHEIEIAGRKEKGTFFGNYSTEVLSPQFKDRPMVAGGKRFKGGSKRGEAKILQTAGGHDWLLSIFSKNEADRADGARRFAEGIAIEFGEAVYPPQYVDKATGGLRRDIDYDKVIGKTVDGQDITVADDIRKNTTYRINPNTPQGQQAITKARIMAKLMLTELGLYKKAFARIEGTLGNPNKFFGNSVFSQGNAGRLSSLDSGTDGMLTGSTRLDDIEGTALYERIQEALMIDVDSSLVGRTPDYGEVDPISEGLLKGERMSGEGVDRIPLINLDDFIKVETNFDDILKQNVKAKEEYNEIVTSWNNTADDMVDEISTNLKLEDEIRNGIFKQFDVDNGPTLIQKFISDIPEGELRNVARPQTVQHWKEQIQIYKQANPNVDPESIDKVWASMLLDGIKKAGDPQDVKLAGGSNQVLGKPQFALALIEKDVVKEMFEAVGVDEKHYKAIRGILAHMTVVDHYRNIGTASAGAMPKKGYTDEGLMSRAFNYARGMVGGHYLAVEAGFKVMRQHDMGMLDWMLNDKQAAKYLFGTLEGKEKVNQFTANTFFDRMGSWIVRNLVARDERIQEFIYDPTKELIVGKEKEEEGEE